MLQIFLDVLSAYLLEGIFKGICKSKDKGALYSQLFLDLFVVAPVQELLKEFAFNLSQIRKVILDLHEGIGVWIGSVFEHDVNDVGDHLALAKDFVAVQGLRLALYFERLKPVNALGQQVAQEFTGRATLLLEFLPVVVEVPDDLVLEVYYRLLNLRVLLSWIDMLQIFHDAVHIKGFQFVREVNELPVRT